MNSTPTQPTRSAQPAPKNLPLIIMLGQMGFRLCLLGLIGFLCSLLVQQWFGYDSASFSLTYQLLISCWGFAAAGGILFVVSQFLIGPFKQKKPKSNTSAKDTAYQLARLGSRYRVFNGIDILLSNGQAQPYPHIAIGPNGVFYLATAEHFNNTNAHQVVLQDLLWGKNIRNVDILGIILPTPRLAETIQQQRTKRRLSQADIVKIASLIEESSRPSKAKPDGKVASPIVWMVPLALFMLVVVWIVMGNQVSRMI